MKNTLIFLSGFLTFFILSANFLNDPQSEVPEISTNGPLAQVLFLNCGNEVSIQKPSGLNNDTYTAEGATVIRSEDGSKIILVPSQPEVTLTINYNGKSIQQKYQAVESPWPYIDVLLNEAPVNMKIGMLSPGPASLTLICRANTLFANLFPKDAKYRVAEWDVILVRGKRPVATNNFKSETGNLRNFAGTAQASDRILIEVKKVTRVNFLNRVEETSVAGTRLFNIPLN